MTSNRTFIDSSSSSRRRGYLSSSALYCITILAHVLTTSLSADAFVYRHSPLIRIPASATCTGAIRIADTRTSTSLMGWFGSKDDDDVATRQPSTSGLSVPALTQGMGKTATTLESFKASQEVGKRTAQLTADLTSMSIEGVAADGRIKAYMDGQQRPTGIRIDEALLEKGGFGAEELNDAITKALADAYTKSLEAQEEKMGALYSDLGLPSTKDKS
mmetsp:Transcript_13586/g.29513  ORF Transcript_13586/g.29513 Transcript_13586/m.29513 type:complete len:217 (+) Transcript_13586:121-771(+)